MREFHNAYYAQHGEWQSAKANRSERSRERRRERQAEMPMRQRYAASYKAQDSRRRMRLKAALVEVFDPREVFERDGWTCRICCTPVDRSAVWPAPLSVSLDHIVPLAKGGDHSRANTRCTHVRCNLAKGAAVEAA